MCNHRAHRPTARLNRWFREPRASPDEYEKERYLGTRGHLGNWGNRAHLEARFSAVGLKRNFEFRALLADGFVAEIFGEIICF